VLKGFPESDQLRGVKIQVSPQKSSKSCLVLYRQRHAPRLPPNGKSMGLRKRGLHSSMETSTNGNDESARNQRATRVHNCSHRVISYVKNDEFQHRIRVGKFSICGLNESEIRRPLFSHSLLLLEDGACNFLALRLSEGGCQSIRS
jgi:hypothetical protein